MFIYDHNNIMTCFVHFLSRKIISDAYGHDRTEKDACLIGAAPELYKAYNISEVIAEGVNRLVESEVKG